MPEEKYSYIDEAGREVHVFEDGKVTKLNMADYIFHGEQWCPSCLTQMSRKDGYWQCDICGWVTDDSDVEENGGIPSLAAALDYREEYGIG